MEQLAEFIQSLRTLLRIAFQPNGDHRTFLAQDEIHFIPLHFTQWTKYSCSMQNIIYILSNKHCCLNKKTVILYLNSNIIRLVQVCHDMRVLKCTMKKDGYKIDVVPITEF